MRLLFAIPQDLDQQQKKLLLLLGAAFFIAQYDMTLLTLALPDVQTSFAIEEENLGRLIAYARLGAIPAILLALLADRIGRRQLLIVSLLALSLFCMATGFAQSATQFMLFQASARMFITLEEILAVTFALEMLPARLRGWGVGFLAAMGALGSGLASLLYGSVEYLPAGWRSLYVLGGLAILYIAWLRRDLTESPLFKQRLREQRQAFWQPLREIYSQHRTAVYALGVICTAFWFQISASLSFMSKYLQEGHHFSPANVSLMFIVAGAAAIFGNVVAGRVSDAIGRRPTLGCGILVNSVALIAFYNTSGILLPLTWIAALFSFFVVEVMVSTVTGELFPTSCRSTATSLRSILCLVVGAIGLVFEGSLYHQVGGHATALSIMALSGLLGLPAITFLLRETANTPLE